MDYENVSNPFITLKKLGGDGQVSEFKAQLNTVPPSIGYDDNRSGIKKPDHGLKSDNRATKLKASDNDGSFKNYSVTLTDIDNVLYEYFTKVISPQVVGPDGIAISVPIRHASPERWAAIQRDGFLRDAKGQLQRPIIVFTRTGMEKDNELVTFNKYLTMPFVKKFDKYNMYDKFSAITGAKPSYEVHNITFPDHVVLSYDFTIITEYVEQMNMIVERVNFAEGDYWGDPKRFKFRASVQSFSNTIEVPSDDDRIVSTTFSVTINAHLLPDIFDNNTTKQRGLTKRKVVWNWENTSNTLETQPKKLPSSRNSFTLHRKQRILYLNDPEIVYRVETWNDESFYELSLLDKVFMISFVVNDLGEDYILWDFNNTDKKLLKGETLNIDLNNGYTAVLKINEYSSLLLEISFKK
tara:strand:+ start:2043 stop:3272 length:1230 start_codon:yes stop_codon:yes gene_type:complete